MKAVVCSAGKLEVTEIPNRRPGPGQVLINVIRSGICGSDLHARVHTDQLADMAATVGYDQMPRHEDKVVFGHEFCGEVVEYGPDTRRRWKAGTPVVAMPMCRDGRDVQFIGASTQVPGGYAEQIVVQESMTFEVPNGLPAAHATLTEPMAVAWHAVRRSRIGKKQNAYVIGCGPIGLAVIAMLKAAGVRAVVASDFSPRRRELAARLGADVVVDPRDTDPFSSSPRPNRLNNVPDLLNLGFDTMEKLRRIPNLPWWHAFRAAYKLEMGPSGPVVFECVGVPGMIDNLLATVPMMSRIIVAGACLEPDTFRPGMAINKEIDLRFSTGYDPGEFRDTLHMLADGTVDPAPLITGTVGFPGVDAAFAALSNTEHAKILIDPASSAATP
ncbi:zinc-binding dehydrogenase [Mycobacterium colombiense]|uniref:Alcohol dehydrogenase n=1 Tax=Mycobacterium colombiense TaxID=339268 RepID=A0A1A2YXP0_9MYCO|nr:zinc-binding dehydrogenase [Mycobacterium colombiense]OBI41686.1 alcohol dehydrogenase [Mycobacterium colombiense]